MTDDNQQLGKDQATLDLANTLQNEEITASNSQLPEEINMDENDFPPLKPKQ